MNADPSDPMVISSELQPQGLPETLRILYQSLSRLVADGGIFPDGEMPQGNAGWYFLRLLEDRILPQLDLPAILAVSLQGPGSSGKSSLFNFIAGIPFSKAGIRAGMTKHSVALVHSEDIARNVLTKLFQGSDRVQVERHRFETEAEEDRGAIHKILWDISDNLSSDLILIDGPDYTTVNEDNWQKAWMSGRVADVILLNVTVDNYNMPATVNFFRRLISDGKKVVVIFNKVHQEIIDQGDWRDVFDHFLELVEAKPYKSFFVPFDLTAAKRSRFHFLEVQDGATSHCLSEQPVDFITFLTQLDVLSLRAQAGCGALNSVLNGEQGGKAFLRRLSQRAGQFRRALNALKAMELKNGVRNEVPVGDIDPQLIRKSLLLNMEWPGLPPEIMLVAVQRYWLVHGRKGFSRMLGRMADRVSNVIAWLPIHPGKRSGLSETVDPVSRYRLEEARAINRLITTMLGALQHTLEPGLLSREAEDLLVGANATAIVESVRDEFDRHRQLQDALDQVLAVMIPDYLEDRRLRRALMHLGDGVWQLTRTTVVAGLPVFSVMFAAHALAATGLLGKVTVGGGALLAGDKGTEKLGEMAAGKTIPLMFNRLSKAYGMQQMIWVIQRVAEKLEPIRNELERGSALDQSGEYQRAIAAVGWLQDWLEKNKT